MIQENQRLRPLEWILAAATALLGAFVLFDAYPGINWAIWVGLTVIVTLLCRRASGLDFGRPAAFIGAAATLTAGAAARTTDVPVHVGIAWLTAFLLGAFLYTMNAARAEEIGLFTLLRSPFLALARVATSAPREIAGAAQAAGGSASRPVLRRVLLVAPVVLLLIFLFGGADPVIHSAIQGITGWLPNIAISDNAVFFAFLFLVTLGACSRLPEMTFGIRAPEVRLPLRLNSGDARVLVGSTLATLVLFLLLQVAYLFVRLPGETGNGITYAEYARRGFGQLCVVVTIVAAVIIFAEHFRDRADEPGTRTLRRMELATVGAAALILLSAQRRVVLYEYAYGYTTSRVHATAYIAFIAVFLILLALELRRGEITSALARRSVVSALAIMLVVLYWNDQAWIMGRNIDRIATTGKFDASYAASLSPDAFPTVVRRRAEIPAAAWDAIIERAPCDPTSGTFQWYEWNPVREAAQSAREAFHVRDSGKCPRLHAATTAREQAAGAP